MAASARRKSKRGISRSGGPYSESKIKRRMPDGLRRIDIGKDTALRICRDFVPKWEEHYQSAYRARFAM